MTVLVVTGSARQDSHTRRLGEQIDAGVELLDASLSVPEVHVRLDDDAFTAELTELLAVLDVEPAAAA